MKSARALSAVIIIGFILIGANLSLTSRAVETTSLHKDKVVLYATEWCGYCKKTREFFKDHGIEYTEYDIEKSDEGRNQYNELNGKGIPLVIINGQVIRGYNPSLIQNLLEI